MGDLNEFFSTWEFACPCGCGQSPVDFWCLQALTKVRRHFGRPVLIRKSPSDKTMHAASRCLAHNRTIPGAKDTSYHPKGMAVDFHVDGIPNQEVYDYLCEQYLGKFGIICYSWGIHFDSGRGGNDCSPRPYRKNHMA